MRKALRESEIESYGSQIESYASEIESNASDLVKTWLIKNENEKETPKISNSTNTNTFDVIVFCDSKVFSGLFIYLQLDKI